MNHTLQLFLFEPPPFGKRRARKRRYVTTPQPTPGKLAPNRRVRGLSSDLLRAAFCDYFGVGGEQADILVVLFERSGDPIQTRDLARALNSHRPPSASSIYERVRVLREIMEPESLDSGGFLNSRGYSLTESGVAECMAALKEMAEALTNCGPETVIDGQRVETIRKAIDP